MKKLLFLFLALFLAETSAAQKIHILFSGKNKVENELIDSLSYQKKHENIKSINKEVELFSDKLLNLGYIDHQISPINKKNDSLYQLDIQLNKRTHFIHIYIGRNSILKTLNNYNYTSDTITIPINKIEFFFNESLSLLEKKGYSLAKLKLINFKKQQNSLTASLKIESGKIRTLNEIVINGIEKFPEGIKINSNRLYSSKTYTQESLKKIEKEFDSYRFVKQTKPPELLFTTDSTKVYVYLEKAKANKFDGFIGFTNDKKNNFLLTGYLDVILLNTLNKGEDITVFWKSDGNNQKTFTTGIGLPYLFKSPIGIKANLNIFKKDSIFQNTKINLDVGYLFKYNSRLYLGYQSTESSEIQGNTSQLIQDFKNKFVTSNYEFLDANTSNLLFPEKTKLNLKAGLGARKSALTTVNQLYISLDLSHTFYWNSKNNLQLKSNHYYLKSKEYLSSELYRFGGINSIRGFNENSLQANFFSSLLTEYRYVLSPQIYMHSILDFGYYKDDSISQKEQLLGLGFGFGLATKNGIINLVYANGSTKEQSVKLSNSIVQISFKTQF